MLILCCITKNIWVLSGEGSTLFSPYVITKLLLPLVRLWWGKGQKALLYLDDGICAVAGEREAGITSQWVKSTLSKAVFVVNEAKST